MTDPTAVVITTVHWPSTTRLCFALAEGGFRILALVPAHHALRRLDPVEAVVLGRTRRKAVRDISGVLGSRSVDLVVPADERAIDLLHATYQQAQTGRAGESRRVAGLIERSLGSPSASTMGRLKSDFVTLARDEGMAVPATTVVHDARAMRQLLADRPFPLVLKLDGTFGGMGVRIVRDAVEGERAFRELRASQGLRGSIKEALRRLDVGCLARRDRLISVQQYIAGRPANRAVACERGRVLAGLSVEVLETSSATGPATVVRVVDRADMAEAARRMVGRLQLSGLVGFDFILEAGTGRAWLLEMNVRPTQTCHLAFDRESDMIGALASQLGAQPKRQLRTAPQRTIALYPQEIWRDPNSPHLISAHHDVPWELPRFIETYRLPLPSEPVDWVDRLRRTVRGLRRSGDREHGEPLRVPGGDRRDHPMKSRGEGRCQSTPT
jgi:D-alanine-D-alanine ligase-like ATP-grasp enzyme